MIFSNNRLGKFIRNGRQDLKLTQEQLAEKLNCNLSYLGNIERGKNIPSLKLFCRIIQILSLSADEFIHQNLHAEDSTYLHTSVYCRNAHRKSLRFFWKMPEH